MKCKDAREMIYSYFDNKTDPIKDKILAEHITSCRDCRSELDFLISYRKLLKEVKPVTPPENFMYELHKKIELEKKVNPVKKFTPILKNFFGTFHLPIEAAGVLAAAAVLFFLYKPFFLEKQSQDIAEYMIESPHREIYEEKNTPAAGDDSDKKIVLNKFTSKESTSDSGKVIYDEKIPLSETMDVTPSADKEKNHNSDMMLKMKKADSPAGTESTIKDENAMNSRESMETEGIRIEEKKSLQIHDSSLEKLFSEYKVTVMNKNLSDRNRLYYRLKIKSGEETSIIKRLQNDFTVEIKIINRTAVYSEIELFLKKN